MRELALQGMQHEYLRSKEVKEQYLHNIWEVITREYRMQSYTQVVSFLERYREADLNTFLTGTGFVASMNVLARKMASLSALQNPEFVFRNKKPMDEPMANLLEHAFSDLQNSMNWRETMKRARQHAVLYGSGFVKVGLTSEYVYGETAWSDDGGKGKEQLLESDRVQPYGVSTEYTNFTVREGDPNVTHVSSYDVFFNLDAVADEDIRRVYVRWRRPLRDVVHDVRYDKRARGDLEWYTLDQLGRDELPVELRAIAGEVQFVEVVECMDLASRQYCVFTPHGRHALRDWTLFPLPVERSVFMSRPIRDPLMLWGIPWALLILGQAQAINQARKVVLDAVGRDGKKVFLFDASEVDPDDPKKFQRALDGTWIAVEGLNRMEKPPVQVLEFPGANAEVLQLATLLERDQAWVSGLTDAARNDSRHTDATATEANLRSQQQDLTLQEFIQDDEQFQEGVAGACAQIMLATWPEEKLIKVTGPNPNIWFWTPVQRARLLGEFRLEIVAGSTQRVDKLTMRKQFTELLPRLMELYQYYMQDQQMAAQGGQAGPIDWLELMREVMDMYDPTMAARIMSTQNTADLLVRLAMRHEILPADVSPQLVQQVRAILDRPSMEVGSVLGQPGLGGGAGGLGAQVPFEVARGVPGVSGVQQGTGQVFSEYGGQESGRALSEGI